MKVIVSLEKDLVLFFTVFSLSPIILNLKINFNEGINSCKLFHIKIIYLVYKI